MTKQQLTVERAAILHSDGTVYSVPRPGRHHNVIALMISLGFPAPIRGEQGFLLSDGSFARRRPALRIARKAGQIKREHAPGIGLFSEDMW